MKQDRSDPAEHARSHRESFLSVYRSNPLPALAQLAYWMTLAARGEYVEAGVPSDLASTHLRAQNEVLIVMAKQLRRALDEPKIGYPEETVLDVIWETPDVHVPTLDWALKQTVDALRNTSRNITDPLVDWKSAIGQLGDRLEHDYLERVSKVARGFGIWGNSTVVGYEIPLGGRLGGMAGNHLQYAKRTGFLGLFGPRVLVRELADIEEEFRREIEGWLREREGTSRSPENEASGDSPSPDV